MDMTSPDDLEAAARAIYALLGGTETSWSDENGFTKKIFVVLTDAAISALTAAGWRKIGDDQVVDFYEREFYPLSNFSAFTVAFNGFLWPTSEQAYHGEKFLPSPGYHGNPNLRREMRHAPSAHAAFKLAERHKDDRRPDWDGVKIGIMAKIIRAKADQHEYVRRKLMETGDRLLIEGSWRDDFWGIGPNGDGQNMLGKLWMAERARRRAMISAYQEKP